MFVFLLFCFHRTRGDLFSGIFSELVCDIPIVICNYSAHYLFFSILFEHTLILACLWEDFMCNLRARWGN